MINYIWFVIIFLSIVCSFATGRTEQLAQSVIDSCNQAVQISITSLGLICLWTGLMNVARESKLTDLISKLLSPIMGFLFKQLPKDNKAISAISMNLTANFLGLSNAATPFGLQAMKEMVKIQPRDLKNTASNSMIMFVVMNSSCIQLLPTMLISLRVEHSAVNPFDILPFIWGTSLSTLLVGVTVVKLFERWGKI